MIRQFPAPSSWFKPRVPTRGLDCHGPVQARYPDSSLMRAENLLITDCHGSRNRKRIKGMNAIRNIRLLPVISVMINCLRESGFFI